MGCGSTMRPGDRIPTHLDLMRRFHASERTVLSAIDELQRLGRVVRRNGIGTFVAAGHDKERPPLLPTSAGTIVALARPDQSFFDHCLRELQRQAALTGATLIYRPLASALDDLLTMPDTSTRPRGFVAFHHSLEPLAVRLQEAGCRVVMVGAPLAGAPMRVPCVHCDHELGGYMAASYLDSSWAIVASPSMATRTPPAPCAGAVCSGPSAKRGAYSPICIYPSSPPAQRRHGAAALGWRATCSPEMPVRPPSWLGMITRRCA